MQIKRIQIRNFKSIQNLVIDDIENALILVGQNSVGKTSVLHAVCAAFGQYRIQPADFNEKKQNIEITIALQITEDDLALLHRSRAVSKYRRKDAWRREFDNRLPSYVDGVLHFTYSMNSSGVGRYSDGFHKHNRYIQEVLPRIYYLDSQRNMQGMQDQILSFSENEMLNQMRADGCLFEKSKKCNHCFSCIGLLHQKTTEELNAFETEKLLEYKLYQLNLNGFSERVSEKFRQNGGFKGQVHYELTCNPGDLFQVNASLSGLNASQGPEPVSFLGKGMRSIYLLSLLEAYLEDEQRTPGILLMEDPEIFLHPRLQKASSEILYRISKKSQVIFTTHSPNLLFQFNQKQIRQMMLDPEGYSVVRSRTVMSAILDDLGFTANDLLNVSFVFIVEGKQDKSRLPLLLTKYYSEIYNEAGELSRIAIITTNSCTNIKTYANLKYMNQIYLRDQFLMIRDGDGREQKELVRELCKYYEDRGKEDVDRLPKVMPQNVLVLKYYSFENYFLDPAVMVKIGIISSEEAFYRILFEKWQEYLYRIRSGRALTERLGRTFESPGDIRDHMEEIRTYMRGHNLYDIFYGRYKKDEGRILKAYIDAAPRSTFQDILDRIDSFLYFDNRKKKEK